LTAAALAIGVIVAGLIVRSRSVAAVDSRDAITG
jgi:hypothetical protein